MACIYSNTTGSFVSVCRVPANVAADVIWSRQLDLKTRRVELVIGRVGVCWACFWKYHVMSGCRRLLRLPRFVCKQGIPEYLFASQCNCHPRLVELAQQTFTSSYVKVLGVAARDVYFLSFFADSGDASCLPQPPNCQPNFRHLHPKISMVISPQHVLQPQAELWPGCCDSPQS